MDRLWLHNYGFQKKQLFLSHRVPDNVDVDTYYEQHKQQLKENVAKPTTTRLISPREEAKTNGHQTNWYIKLHAENRHYTGNTSDQYICGGIVDYSKELQNFKRRNRRSHLNPQDASSSDTRIRRKRLNFLDSRSMLCTGNTLKNIRINIYTSIDSILIEMLKFAKGNSKWNRILNTPHEIMDTARIYKFVDNAENGRDKQSTDAVNIFSFNYLR